MTSGSASSGTPPLSWCDALEAEFLALRGVPALDDQGPSGCIAKVPRATMVMRDLDPMTAAQTRALDDPTPVDRLRCLAPSGGISRPMSGPWS